MRFIINLLMSINLAQLSVNGVKLMDSSKRTSILMEEKDVSFSNLLGGSIIINKIGIIQLFRDKLIQNSSLHETIQQLNAIFQMNPRSDAGA